MQDISQWKEEFLDLMRGGAAPNVYDWESIADWWIAKSNKAITEERKRIVELLDEKAFEDDDDYKVELFINWDEVKPLLAKTLK